MNTVLKYIFFIFTFYFCFTHTSTAKNQKVYKERHYQEKWCTERGGQTEVVMPDRTRCDCVTKTHAIEFDFAKKWAESIGQSLLYSAHTGKKAGIVLILKNKKEERFVKRLKTAIKHSNIKIDLWIIKNFIE